MIFKVIKSSISSKYTAQQTSVVKKKRYYKKSTLNLIWSKRPFTPEHRAGKKSLKKAY